MARKRVRTIWAKYEIFTNSNTKQCYARQSDLIAFVSMHNQGYQHNFNKPSLEPASANKFLKINSVPQLSIFPLLVAADEMCTIGDRQTMILQRLRQSTLGKEVLCMKQEHN